MYSIHVIYTYTSAHAYCMHGSWRRLRRYQYSTRFDMLDHDFIMYSFPNRFRFKFPKSFSRGTINFVPNKRNCSKVYQLCNLVHRMRSISLVCKFFWCFCCWCSCMIQQYACIVPKKKYKFWRKFCKTIIFSWGANNTTITNCGLRAFENRPKTTIFWAKRDRERAREWTTHDTDYKNPNICIVYIKAQMFAYTQ